MERRRYSLRSQAKSSIEPKRRADNERCEVADILRRIVGFQDSSSDEDEIPPIRPKDMSKMTDQLAESSPSLPLPDLKIEPVDRPDSPETNCAICLEEFNNKAYTNSCFHEFCYQCLREWSKIKPECPLCKQRFTTIIHTIRNEEYEEYHVEVPHNGGGLGLDHSVLINFAFQRNPVPSYPYRNTMSFRRLMEDENVYHSRSMLSHPPLFYIHPTTLSRIAPENNEPSAFETDYNTVSLGISRNRRDVYRHNRWVRPSTSSRFRESSPEFYRLNPAQTHRLVPWLTRELNVLLDLSVDPQAYVEEVIRLITMYPICSRQFREALQPALGERTAHFIHEFFNYAVSTHDMMTYDMVASYEVPPPGSFPVRVNNDSDSESEVEVVHILPKLESGQSLLDLSRAGPSSSSTSSQTLGEGYIITISDSSSDSEVEIVNVPPPPPPETIVIDDSTESENEIKPEFSNGNFNVRNPPGKVDYAHRGECSRGSGSGMHMLNNIEDELVNYRNTSSYENVSRSPTPPMPYLRPINSKEPTSPSTSNSISICSSQSSSTPTPSSSSSSSASFDYTSSDSDYSDHVRKHRKKRKKPQSSRRDKTPKKKVRKSVFKVDYSSSDEEYQPRSSRPRLKSVVVKPETSRAKRSQRCSSYIFPHSD